MAEAMRKEHTKSKILVLGVGNSILRDEGLGVHLARRLREEELPPQVEVYDGGTQGLELLGYLDDVAGLIIVDCIKAGAEPGTIFRFEPHEVEVIPKEYKLSFHDLGIYDFLQVAAALDMLPPTVIVGMEPAEVTWGETLSPVVEARLDVLKEVVLKEIERMTTLLH